jgi:transmembrane sensor
MQDSAQVEETAATWLALRDAGGWSAADAIGLTTWLDVSTEHRIAYVRLEAAWHRTRCLRHLAEDEQLDEPDGEDRHRRAPGV